MVKSAKITVFDVALISILTAILFAQEQILISIPGVQLTVFLIILYSKVFGLIKTSIIVVLYVLLDNFFMNTFSLIYTPTMLVGWLLIPITLSTVFKNVESPFILSILGMAYSFIYCWLYMIPNYFLLNVGPIEYLISDILFEVILAICSFLSIFWLYKPCEKLMRLLLKEGKKN